jgi:hypothetical protein
MSTDSLVFVLLQTDLLLKGAIKSLKLLKAPELIQNPVWTEGLIRES